MSLPVVAVVGRPNVGKSTFFNRIVGNRLSIIEDTPGVTRDRIYAEAEWNGKRFALIDTGGIDPDTEDVIMAQMREQAVVAMEMADVIVFVTDVKEGLTPADREVALMLRRARAKVVLLANKADNAGTKGTPENLYDFYELGLGDPIPVSAANMTNLGDVLDEITLGLPESGAEEDDDAVKIAVIGKPNVGKSSFVNAILGEQRVIVSDIAGTTRDSIDTPFEIEGEKFVLIDTAGIRRKARVKESIEYYSTVRAIGAVERSDVCVLMIDAQDGVTDQDKRIAGIAHEAGKGIVIAVNKWDLIKKETGTLEEFEKRMEREMPFLGYAPIIFISVVRGQRLGNVMNAVRAAAENRSMRIPTGELNSLVQDAVMMHAPPSDKGKRMKIYYATQVGIRPPLFSFQINSRKLLHFSYSRYLENRIREAYGFGGTSIKFVFREKADKRA
ncbi:MAG: ribosome biogenesis GTPase Der [Clostridiales Family XIII bacterium]|jgi:GTP-binding protein|nr:ribosome biogenesis GTPase Der [Clostridiales Family XIII bacterium]